MERANGIDPALREKALIRRAALGLQKGVMIPGLRLVNVEVCRHNVVISRQHDRRCTRVKRNGLRQTRRGSTPPSMRFAWTAIRRHSIAEGFDGHQNILRTLPSVVKGRLCKNHANSAPRCDLKNARVLERTPAWSTRESADCQSRAASRMGYPCSASADLIRNAAGAVSSI